MLDAHEEIGSARFPRGDELPADEEIAVPVANESALLCGLGGTHVPFDTATLNRLYPITTDNLAAFPGKTLTAGNTVSMDGTIAFRSGVGMQGVNVVVRPLDGNGNPLNAYTVTAVSGAYFSGKHSNAVNGSDDEDGVRLSRWGSNDLTLQGYFDLRYMPLPPGGKPRFMGPTESSKRCGTRDEATIRHGNSSIRVRARDARRANDSARQLPLDSPGGPP